jgi:C_GCAxxG_C_C family probable redox protein
LVLGWVAQIISAALMVIGLRYGGIRPDDTAAKEKTCAVAREFLQEFKTVHGSVACTDLLGYNLSDPQQFAGAKTHQVAMERCPVFIRPAVELVEKIVF